METHYTVQELSFPKAFEQFNDWNLVAVSNKAIERLKSCEDKLELLQTRISGERPRTKIKVLEAKPTPVRGALYTIDARVRWMEKILTELCDTVG